MSKKDQSVESGKGIHKNNIDNKLEIHCLYVGKADFNIIKEIHKGNSNEPMSFMVTDAGILNPLIGGVSLMEKITHSYFRKLGEKNDEEYMQLINNLDSLQINGNNPDINYKLPLKAVVLSHFHADHMSLILKYIITYRPKIVFLPRNYSEFLKIKKKSDKPNIIRTKKKMKELILKHCSNYSGDEDKIKMPSPSNPINTNINPDNENIYKFNAIIPPENNFKPPAILLETMIEFPYFNRLKKYKNDQNAQSLVFQLKYPKGSVEENINKKSHDGQCIKEENPEEKFGSALFTGDLPLLQWEQLWWSWKDKLHSVLLKVAHHGSMYSNSHYIIKDVKPEFAIITSNKTIDQVLKEGSTENDEPDNKNNSSLPNKIVVDGFLYEMKDKTIENLERDYIELPFMDETKKKI